MVALRAMSSTMRMSLPALRIPLRTALLMPELIAIVVYHQAGT